MIWEISIKLHFLIVIEKNALKQHFGGYSFGSDYVKR